jgi:hypothetical protein
MVETMIGYVKIVKEGDLGVDLVEKKEGGIEREGWGEEREREGKRDVSMREVRSR